MRDKNILLQSVKYKPALILKIIKATSEGSDEPAQAQHSSWCSYMQVWKWMKTQSKESCACILKEIFTHICMGESFNEYSWIQDFGASFIYFS